MKHLLIATLLVCIGISLYAQEVDSTYPGVYKPMEKNGDPQGGVTLYITPEHTYTFAFFGGVESGTWKDYDGYFIMQPDTTINEHFYMFAGYNDKLKNISVQFDEFSDVLALYSFDNDGFQKPMHPVFNPYPNCTTYPYVLEFSREEHHTIQLLSLVNQRSKYDQDSITDVVYTFSLDPKYNDFKLVCTKKPEYALLPMIAVKPDNILKMGAGFFYKAENWEDVKGENLEFLNTISKSIGRPFTDIKISDFLDDSSDPEIEYSVIKYEKKEQVTVGRDNKNLFHAECGEGD